MACYFDKEFPDLVLHCITLYQFLQSIAIQCSLHLLLFVYCMSGLVYCICNCTVIVLLIYFGYVIYTEIVLVIVFNEKMQLLFYRIY